MKLKTLALTAAIGMAATLTYAQGVFIWNIANSGGPSATSNGLLYTNTVPGTVGAGIFNGLDNNVGIEAFGGSGSAGNSLGVFKASTDPKGYTGFDMGKFQAGNSVAVAGVAAGGIATIRLDIWYDGAGGLFPNYAAAAAGGGKVASATFENPTGAASPPIPDQQMVGMPSMILAPIPEPTTIALFGLGVGSLLLFRRRK